MASPQNGDKRVNPAAMQVALLDEMCERLMKLAEQLPQKPEGIVEPLTPTKASITPRVIHPPYSKKWFSISIVNDGPEDCWVVVNTEKSPAQPYCIRAGEEYSASLGYPAIEDIRVYTNEGTANLRIKGVR